jgi:O-antigen ligase
MTAMSTSRALPSLSLPTTSDVGFTGYKLALFFVVNIGLALLMQKSGAFATVHAVLTLTVGVWYATRGGSLERVAWVAAYMIGTEIIWRMAGARLPWEFAKYATSAVFILAMFRNGLLKGPALPTIYVLLLIPSAVLTAMELDNDEARSAISFYLSGPIALTASAWFFSQVKLTTQQLATLFLALLGPIAGIAAIALSGILTDPNIMYGFAATSNYATSGGYAPNQVSSLLGLGALLALFFVLDERGGWTRRIGFISGATVFAIQSALTFSRGGLYNIAVALLLALPFLIRDPRTRLRVILVAVILVVATNYVILPRLEAFTRGNLSNRFESVETTGREDLSRADLQLWQEHPLLGVGPGMAELNRESSLKGIAAHTEFSRLVAEHGTLGFAALLALLLAGVQCVLSARGNTNKAVVAALLGWSLFDMLHGAMRMGAPGFLFGLAFASVVPAGSAAIVYVLKRRRSSALRGRRVGRLTDQTDVG